MAKKSSTKNKGELLGTASNDILTVKHTQVTVKAGKGKKDVINVNKGSNHRVYGEAGTDVITIKSTGTGMKVYGDDDKGTKSKITGNDTFNIYKGAKNYFYGGKGTDTFNVYGGGTAKAPNYLYGGAGNDVFVIAKNSTGNAVVKDFRSQSGNFDKVKVSGGEVKNITFSKDNVIIAGGESGSLTLTGAKKRTVTITETNGEYSVTPAKGITMTLKKSYTGSYYAPSFVDNINVQSVKSGITTVKGNAKKNQINAAWMDGGTYQGGDGDDVIIAKKGSNHRIYGDDESGTSTGNDRISVEGGDGHTIYGQYGNDTITVSYGANHKIYGGVGNDTISVTEGHSHEISGEAGNDTITLNNVKGNDNQKSYVYGGDGTDTIIVKNSSNVYVNGQNGVGNYTVNNSSNVKVQSEGDYGTFAVSSCADTTIRLNSTSENNVNTVNVSGTANSVTVETAYSVKDDITVNWCDNFGNLTIWATRESDSQYADKLYINAAKSNFNFYKTGSSLQIEGKGGEILINNFYINDGWMSFMNGITFSDQTVFTYNSNVTSK